MVDMTTKDNIYGIPNIGCLLGIAYQTEMIRLGDALAAQGLGITPAEYLILRVLYANGAVQQCEISRILRKDKAGVSRSLQSLLKKGLVDADPVSYKCCMVSLTEDGEALKPRVLELAEKLHHDLADKITPQQMKNLREILEAITK